MYEVILAKEAQQDLARLDPANRRQVSKRIDWLAEHTAEIEPQALTGDWAGFFKLRVGDYRVLYWVKAETIIVFRVRHRREVYD